MLFCAGVGAALIYWATIEWTYYIDEPPFGAVAGGEVELFGVDRLHGAARFGASGACGPGARRPTAWCWLWRKAGLGFGIDGSHGS